jgi:hypothetical protein
MTSPALVPRKRQAATVTKAEHLRQAKHDLADAEKLLRNGMASCRSAAEHIAAAIDQGATQCEVAKAIGKSQPWVNSLLKWFKAGDLDGSTGPFAIASRQARIVNKAKLDQSAYKKSDPPAPKVQPPFKSPEELARFAGARDRAAELGCTLQRDHPWFYLTSDQGTERHKTIEQVQHALDIEEEVKRAPVEPKDSVKPEPLTPDQMRAFKALRKRAENLGPFGYSACRRGNGEFYLIDKEKYDEIECDGGSLDGVARQLDIIENAQPATEPPITEEEWLKTGKEKVAALWVGMAEAAAAVAPRLEVFDPEIAIEKIGAEKAEAFARAILAALQ